MSAPLVFLKLGGSLITDKHQTSTALPETIARLAGEIVAAKKQQPDLQLVLGHGSGSFGHKPAKQYNTRQGVDTPEEWRGFAEVWWQASALNRIVVAALHEAGLSPINLPASAAALAQDGRVASWDLTSLQTALEKGLLPVVHGDVAFDQVRGGTIFSTEDLFNYLAVQLQPQRILLAGIESGVWADYPACTELIEQITPAMLNEIAPALGGSAATDVTGGMDSKVGQMLALVDSIPDLEILIFSGAAPGTVQQALLGAAPGTRISA